MYCLASAVIWLLDKILHLVGMVRDGFQTLVNNIVGYLLNCAAQLDFVQHQMLPPEVIMDNSGVLKHRGKVCLSSSRRALSWTRDEL